MCNSQLSLGLPVVGTEPLNHRRLASYSLKFAGFMVSCHFIQKKNLKILINFEKPYLLCVRCFDRFSNNRSELLLEAEF